MITPVTHRVINRTQPGSMLVVCIGTGLLIVIAGLLFIAVQYLFLKRNSLQYLADNVAMNAARVLNERDNTGRINNLVSESRELVFEARQTFNESDATFKFFEPLSKQFLDEAKDGARLVQKERNKLIQYQLGEIRRQLRAFNKNESSPLSILLVKSYQPRISQFEIGYLTNQNANVSSRDGNSELIEFDKGKGFVDEHSHLYRPNRLLNMPGEEDNDLKFVLSPLPSPVRDTTAPARLMLGTDFVGTLKMIKNEKEEFGGCALPAPVARVVLSMRVDVTKNDNVVEAKSFALTVGGLPPP